MIFANGHTMYSISTSNLKTPIPKNLSTLGQHRTNLMLSISMLGEMELSASVVVLATGVVEFAGCSVLRLATCLS